MFYKNSRFGNRPYKKALLNSDSHLEKKFGLICFSENTSKLMKNAF